MAKAKKAAAPAATNSSDASEEAVLKYLQQQNRPYSAVDIFNNLHGAVGKTAIGKVLQSLMDQGEVVGKAYGKQWVYVVRQDNLPTPSPEELEALDEEVKTAKAKLQDEKEKVRTLSSTLSGLENSMTTEEMTARLAQLNQKNERSRAKLDELRSGGRKVDPVEKAKIDVLHDKYHKAWKARRKLCMEIVGSLCEGMGKKPRALMEELGLEQDVA